MTTLTVMKARIASELRRSNISTQIADAITTAIEAYQDERWLFNESRTGTFTTVAGTEHYSAAPLTTLLKIDYVKLLLGTTPYSLSPADPSEVESWSDSGTASGQPDVYVWYGQQMRLYPVPDQVYTVRVAGVYVAAAPADDSEANNAWMTTGERLIRSRAKWELAKHVLRDEMLASDMAEATQEAWTQLKKRTNRLTGTGRIAPMYL